MIKGSIILAEERLKEAKKEILETLRKYEVDVKNDTLSAEDYIGNQVICKYLKLKD